eukprot:2000025-Alexandrium_andersonii.AAC.1
MHRAMWPLAASKAARSEKGPRAMALASEACEGQTRPATVEQSKERAPADGRGGRNEQRSFRT